MLNDVWFVGMQPIFVHVVVMGSAPNVETSVSEAWVHARCLRAITYYLWKRLREWRNVIIRGPLAGV